MTDEEIIRRLRGEPRSKRPARKRYSNVDLAKDFLGVMAIAITLYLALLILPAFADGLEDEGLADPVVANPCRIFWGVLPCHGVTKDETTDRGNVSARPLAGVADSGDAADSVPDKHRDGDRPHALGSGHDPRGDSGTDRLGNPGNDKPVGRAGEKPDKDMAERGDAGNRGRSN